MNIKFLLFTCFFFILSVSFSQTNGQLFVKQKLNVLLSVIDKDLETVKTICKSESGLIRQENSGEIYTYTYQSPGLDYYFTVSFYFNRLFCKKIKIEIMPIDINDLKISKVVTKTLKRKFKIKKDSITDKKTHTINSFLSNGIFSGILSLNADSKKIILILSIKDD